MIHAELSKDAINPKLFPKDHHFSRLVIQDVHEKLCHAGLSHTLAQLCKQCWIPQGRATVKRLYVIALTVESTKEDLSDSQQWLLGQESESPKKHPLHTLDLIIWDRCI